MKKETKIELVEAKKKPMTKSLAQWMLAMPELTIAEAKVDRDLSDTWSNILADRMRTGEFIYEIVNFVVCSCDQKIGSHPPGTVFRMNGQHTCTAFLRYVGDSNTAKGGMVNILQYKVKTIEEMRVLYSLQDRGRARTNSDVVNAHLAGSSGFVGASKRTLGVLVTGLQFWLRPVDAAMKHERRQITIDEASALTKTVHIDTAQLVCRFLCEDGTMTATARSILYRTPVVAAMYATFEKEPVKAHEFWTAVRDCIGLESRDDPRYRLHQFLRDCVLANIKTKATDRAAGRHVVGGEEMYRKSLIYWNGFCQGKNITSMPYQWKSGSRPETLAFTLVPA
jgi:hypothetical protein